MLGWMTSEPFASIAIGTFAAVIVGTHGVLILLAVFGILLKPFAGRLQTSTIVWPLRHLSRLLFPWIYLCGESPAAISETPFRPSRLLLIHALWLFSSVGLWTAGTLFHIGAVFAALFPDVLGITVRHNNLTSGEMAAGYAILAFSFGIFAVWSFTVWLRSLRRSSDHFQYVRNVENHVRVDDPDQYLAPFKRATLWSFASLPIYFVIAVLSLALFPP